MMKLMAYDFTTMNARRDRIAEVKAELRQLETDLITEVIAAFHEGENRPVLETQSGLNHNKVWRITMPPAQREAIRAGRRKTASGSRGDAGS
jgi:hypothetical protein